MDTEIIKVDEIIKEEIDEVPDKDSSEETIGSEFLGLFGLNGNKAVTDGVNKLFNSAADFAYKTAKKRRDEFIKDEFIKDEFINYSSENKDIVDYFTECLKTEDLNDAIILTQERFDIDDEISFDIPITVMKVTIKKTESTIKIINNFPNLSFNL